jgi:hypothetical protein
MIYLQGGPKAGAEVPIRAGTTYWSWIEQIPGMEAEATFEESPPPIDTVKRHRVGMYRDSGQKMPRVFGAPMPIFTWQGYQE